MPEIARFLGIVIFIYYREHGVPHFHARYGDAVAVIGIDDLQVLEGTLPRRVLSLVIEWAFEHRRELSVNWELAQQHKPLNSIAPLE